MSGQGITAAQALEANTGGASETDLLAAAAAANQAPAPANPIEAFMANLAARMASIEGVLGLVSPLENVVLSGVETVVPASVPIISAVSELQTIVTGMLGAFSGAFGAKVPMPAAPAVAPHPSVPAGGTTG